MPQLQSDRWHAADRRSRHERTYCEKPWRPEPFYQPLPHYEWVGPQDASDVRRESKTPSSDLESAFNDLVAKWWPSSLTASSPHYVALQPAYQSMIALGWPAVPLLIREMQ